MAKGGDKDSATWPAEGWRINGALHLLCPIAWAKYVWAAREAESDLHQPGYVVVGSAEDRRLVAYEQAKHGLEIELRSLLGGQDFELWGRLESPIADAQRIPASALGALTIDFTVAKADGQGMPLFDLRLRRRTLPAIQEDAQETAKSTAVDLIRPGAPGRPTGMHIVLEEAKRKLDAKEVVARPKHLKKFSHDLYVWYEALRHSHKPPWPKLTAGSIENKIRELWNSRVSPPRNCP